MDTPGIEVRPIKDMTTNRHFCEVFFTDVRVPVEQPRRRRGRGVQADDAPARARARRHRPARVEPGAVQDGARARRHVRPDRSASRSPRSRSAIASAGSWSSARCCARRPQGFSAATKCFCTEHELRVAEFVAHVLGAEATLWDDVTHGLLLRAGLHDHGWHVERHAQHPRRARAGAAPRTASRRAPWPIRTCAPMAESVASVADRR